MSTRKKLLKSLKRLDSRDVTIELHGDTFDVEVRELTFKRLTSLNKSAGEDRQQEAMLAACCYVDDEPLFEDLEQAFEVLDVAGAGALLPLINAIGELHGFGKDEGNETDQSPSKADE